MDLERAAAVLRAGGLVAFPTETVYGLGADAASDGAVRRLLAVKRRPEGQAVSVLLSPETDFGQWAAWSREAGALARAFWPGPLTLVLPRTARVSPVVTGGQDTVGLRVPDHPVALGLLRAFGGGLATPSANRSGGLSPTTAAHVRAELGDDVDLVLDGGATPLGLESTVISLVGEPAVLRPGGVTLGELEAVLGRRVALAVSVPALVLRARVRLVPEAELEAELGAEPGPVGVISPTRPRGAHAAWVAAPPDPAAYARGLYASLRDLDEGGCSSILVSDPPEGASWAAVRYRLAMASRGELPVPKG